MRTIKLDDGTELGCYGRDGLYLPTDDHRRYRRSGDDGVAWQIVGQCVDMEEDIDEETGDSLGYSPVLNGMVAAIMVGDDRIHVYDKDDFDPIGDDDYCHECGQIGCTHDGRDR